MSDLFDNITTRMDIRKSSVDTTYDKSRFSSRAIKKVSTQITIPILHFTNVSETYWGTGIPVPPVTPGRVSVQYNFDAAESFRILNATKIQAINVLDLSTLVLRWRIGTVVTRYRLNTQPVTTTWTDVTPTNPGSASFTVQVAAGYDMLPHIPVYNLEVIPRYFSIEVWSQVYFSSISRNNTTDGLRFGVKAPIVFEMSKLALPTSANSVPTQIAVQNSITEWEAETPKDDSLMFSDLIVDPRIAWTSN